MYKQAYSNVKGYATCKQGRSCDRRGRSAACNSSVLPYQASSATVQCRFKIRFWKRDLIFTSRGASGGKVQSSSGSKNTRTREPAVKTPVISTLHTTHFTLLVIDNLCLYCWQLPEDMWNEGRCSFAKVRVR